MQNLMRKHKRAVMVVTLAFVIVPFVVWGGYRRASRDNTPGEGPTVVATVGPIAIRTAEYQGRLNEEAERINQRTGQRPTFEDMAKDGTAERLLEGMIDRALFNIELDRHPINVERKYVIEMLKRDPSFHDEEGNFDSRAWNAWVEGDEKRNWNAVYANVSNQLAREMLLARVMGPARVLDSEVRKQFEDNHTKIQLKYVAIEPKIEPTEEQVQAQYDEDPSRYQIPEKRTAEFIGVSLAPPRPALVDELVKRARDGEDFAALAKEYSDSPDKESGGSLGWVEHTPNAPEYLEPVFEVAVGEVSDVVESGNAFYIYKVEEERTEEETGLRSVNARRILVRVELDDADRAARTEKAAGILAEAKATGDLEAAAEQAGLSVQRAESFAEDSATIDNVPPQDTYKFRTELAKLDLEEFSEVVEARQNLYIAKIVAVEPPVIQALEDVRDEVYEDAIEMVRQSPEHLERVEVLAEDIAAKADSLEEIVRKFPELELEIKETREFTRKDFFVDPGLYLQAVEVYNTVGQKEPGAFAGPLYGFRHDAYFIELVSKTPPTEEDWENEWPKEEEQLRQSEIMAKRNALVKDYLADLRERLSTEVPVQRNYAEIANILGTAKEEPLEEPAPEDADGSVATQDSPPDAEAAPETSEQEPESAAPEAPPVTGETASEEAPAPQATEEPAPEPGEEPAGEKTAPDEGATP